MKRKTLHKKAWTRWSLYRRKSAADFQDNVICFTCDKSINYKEANLGHFKHGKLDFDPVFTQIQCVGCNLWKHGKLDEYGIRLVKKYGLKVVNAKVLESNTRPPYSIEELNQIINKYSNATINQSR